MLLRGTNSHLPIACHWMSTICCCLMDDDATMVVSSPPLDETSAPTLALFVVLTRETRCCPFDEDQTNKAKFNVFKGRAIPIRFSDMLDPFKGIASFLTMWQTQSWALQKQAQTIRSSIPKLHAEFLANGGKTEMAPWPRRHERGEWTAWNHFMQCWAFLCYLCRKVQYTWLAARNIATFQEERSGF